MPAADVVSLLRRGMLGLLLLGAAGLIGELVLLEHYEDPQQFIPFALLGATLVVGDGTRGTGAGPASARCAS